TSGGDEPLDGRPVDPGRGAEVGDVAGDDPRGARVGLDEVGAIGASRQRLQCQGPRAGEEVEDGESVEPPEHRSQRGEHRLADTIRRRAGAVAAGRREPPSTPPSGDDPRHARSRYSARSDSSRRRIEASRSAGTSSEARTAVAASRVATMTSSSRTTDNSRKLERTPDWRTPSASPTRRSSPSSGESAKPSALAATAAGR